MTKVDKEIKEEYTTIVDIEDCIHKFSLMLKAGDAKNQLWVKANRRLEEFDIRLIGYFILFQKRQNT